MFYGAEIYSAIFWGAIVCFVLIGSLFKFLSNASRHRMIEKLAEKGQSITPELLAKLGESSNGNSGNHPISSSFILMFIGIAIAVFLWALSGGGGLWPAADQGVPVWLPVVGIFPFAIGLGRLLGYAFERRSER